MKYKQLIVYKNESETFYLSVLCINFEFLKLKYMAGKGKFNLKWGKILKNKYFIASILFLAWIVFFDENSFVSHSENKRRLKEFTRQKEYYEELIRSDKQKLEDLSAGEKELERFAREQFFMSKPDEDIYIVVEED